MKEKTLDTIEINKKNGAQRAMKMEGSIFFIIKRAFDQNM
jgi:hypothetical protein